MKEFQMPKYKLAVVIGRFQPFHNGHLEIVKEALKQAEQVLILVGSSNRPRTPKNPFTFAERQAIINASLFDNGISTGVIVNSLDDFIYDEHRWERQVQDKIAEQIVNFDLRRSEVVIVGHSKDESSYYLKSFPQYDVVELPIYANGVDATTIRDELFTNRSFCRINPYNVSHDAIRVINGIRDWNGVDFKNIYNERLHIERERNKFGDYPYDGHLNVCAADALVVCGGHILLIERGEFPFKGCMALVGGHKQDDETFQQCAIRELKEETQLKVPTKVLLGSCKGFDMFDKPDRDPVLTKPTMVYLFDIECNADGSLPKVNGMDDAARAVWVPLKDIKSDNMAFDHYDIISKFLSI